MWCVLMRRSAITLTLFAVVASSCSLVRGDARVTNFGDEADAALSFTAAEEEPSGIAIGSAAVTDEGVARDAIDFIASDLLSGGDVSGAELFGAGSVIATFVEPGCQFSGEQGALLAKTASAEESTTFVFIHSGATPGAFKGYPSTLLIDGAGKMSSARGALDSGRLALALSIVEVGSN
jgi:hypothetical protein